jgi:hypothetical protein
MRAGLSAALPSSSMALGKGGPSCPRGDERDHGDEAVEDIRRDE